MGNRRTPLSPSAEKALEHLVSLVDDSDGISRDRAEASLRDEGFDAELAVSVLDQLLQKGYLYEVDGELFVT